MTSPDPAAVAATLSEAQRHLILNRLSENFEDVPRSYEYPNAMRGWATKTVGLLESRHGRDFYQVRLTPLGLAVRQVLLSAESGR